MDGKDADVDVTFGDGIVADDRDDGRIVGDVDAGRATADCITATGLEIVSPAYSPDAMNFSLWCA